jgi:hypothetical protein
MGGMEMLDNSWLEFYWITYNEVRVFVFPDIHGNADPALSLPAVKTAGNRDITERFRTTIPS